MTMKIEQMTLSETDAQRLIGCSPRRWRAMIRRSVVKSDPAGFRLLDLVRGALAFERAAGQRRAAQNHRPEPR
jgi:hypothetical protein